jgi:hypothetical protein
MLPAMTNGEGMNLNEPIFLILCPISHQFCQNTPRPCLGNAWRRSPRSAAGTLQRRQNVSRRPRGLSAAASRATGPTQPTASWDRKRRRKRRKRCAPWTEYSNFEHLKKNPFENRRLPQYCKLSMCDISISVSIFFYIEISMSKTTISISISQPLCVIGIIRKWGL